MRLPTWWELLPAQAQLCLFWLMQHDEVEQDRLCKAHDEVTRPLHHSPCRICLVACETWSIPPPQRSEWCYAEKHYTWAYRGQQHHISPGSYKAGGWCYLNIGTVRYRRAVTPETTYNHQQNTKGRICIHMIVRRSVALLKTGKKALDNTCLAPLAVRGENWKAPTPLSICIYSIDTTIWRVVTKFG